jgi:hypothetical protein
VTQEQAKQAKLVLIGPFALRWSGERRILIEYKGGNIIPDNKKEIWLDPSRIHNAYVDGNKHYYLIYETENVDYYLQYATKLPENTNQVNVLKAPYGCKYNEDDEDEEVMTNEEDCWEADLADGVEWLYKEYRIPNDADPGQALSDYRPDLSNANVLIKYLEMHGIKTMIIGSLRVFGLPPSCKFIELRGLGEGVENIGGVDIPYRDVVGFEYCFFYDDPWPTATRIKKLRIYKGAVARDLGDVPPSEVTDEELKQLDTSEALAVAATYDDKEALEILQRTGIKPSEFWLLEQKPGLIPYYADEIVTRAIERLRNNADAYKNPYSYEVNEKILAAARRELVEEYNKLMSEVMVKYEEYAKAEEERRRREEEERRRRAEELARRVVRELARRGISVEVEVDGAWVRVRSKEYLGKGRFNEFVRTVKSLGFRFEPRGKYWYYYA